MSQVVSASEGATYHNRMIHSLKVAQVGRRLAESLVTWHVELTDQLNPDVVETAALAHDLGHPPFGHIGEETLSRLAKENKEHKLTDGYEGNAQNLRILTNLEISGYGHGLDLTRATLQAIIKYPWTYSDPKTKGKRSDKFGFYETERPVWNWLGGPVIDGHNTIECQVMEWADDVSYALHDLTDFYRIGLIPLEHFSDVKSLEAKVFAEAVEASEGIPKDETLEIIDTCISSRAIVGPYQGTIPQREKLYMFINNNLDRFLAEQTFRVNKDADRYFLDFDPAIKNYIKVLKYFTVHYVINSYALNSIQVGQEKCIEMLVSTFLDASLNDKFHLIPNLYKEKLQLATSKDEKTRLIIDLVASLTDQQAFELSARFSGFQIGSIRNPII